MCVSSDLCVFECSSAFVVTFDASGVFIPRYCDFLVNFGHFGDFAFGLVCWVLVLGGGLPLVLGFVFWLGIGFGI